MRFATKEQLLSSVRSRYREADGVERYRLSKKINELIAAGVFTDAELRQSFGLTVAQWAILKSKMSGHANAYENMQIARGE